MLDDWNVPVICFVHAVLNQPLRDQEDGGWIPCLPLLSSRGVHGVLIWAKRGSWLPQALCRIMHQAQDSKALIMTDTLTMDKCLCRYITPGLPLILHTGWYTEPSARCGLFSRSLLLWTGSGVQWGGGAGLLPGEGKAMQNGYHVLQNVTALHDA